MPNPNYHGGVRLRNTRAFVAFIPVRYAVLSDGSLSHAAKLVSGSLDLYTGKPGSAP